MRLIKELALAGQSRDGLQAHCRHGNEQKRDEHERAQKLRVDGSTNARDPPHQKPQGRTSQKEAGNFVAQSLDGWGGRGRMAISESDLSRAHEGVWEGRYQPA